jgi:hypothetical protein
MAALDPQQVPSLDEETQQVPSLDEETQRRLADNEARFRNSNERIEESAIRLDGRDHHYPFVCECGRIACRQMLSLRIVEYEHVRSSPFWFLHWPGHAITASGIATVVERHPGYEIVEKYGVAGEVAQATDPRSSTTLPADKGEGRGDVR